MRSSIKLKIERIRNYIARHPESAIAVRVGSKEQAPVPETGSPLDAYTAFLNECNGARFGFIDITSRTSAAGLQFITSTMPQTERQRWLAIGRMYDPLLLSRYDGRLTLYTPPQYGEAYEDLGDFEDFVDAVALGPKYIEYTPLGTGDFWYQLQKKLDLA